MMISLLAEAAGHAAQSATGHAAETGGGHHGVDLLPIVILLAVAVLTVPLFKRLGLGTVLGYLAGGLLVGPFGFGVFNDPLTILNIAELGVVLFLFIIGLEMQPSRLWAMRGEIFGLGVAQVGVCIALLTCVGLALGFPLVQSFVAGTGFVLTSTAVAVQMVEERHALGLPKGRRVIAILLLEDLAIVPLLALVVFLAPSATEVTTMERLTSIGIGIGAVVALVLAGRYLLDPMFRLLSKVGAREVMTAAALLVVLGAAYAMQAAGLSMAMGAFMAGVLLSESAFRHQLEADIEPFRGILLGLFFLSVGMALNLHVVSGNIGLIAMSVVGYMVLKALGIFTVARLFGADNREALERAVIMAQGGEFAFVLYAAAGNAGLIDPTANAVLTAVIIISMALTPLVVILHDKLLPAKATALDGLERADNETPQVLMIGFGRFGQVMSQPLLAHGVELSIIDTNPNAIVVARDFGMKVYYGDGTRMDILHAAGAHHAQAIIVAIDNVEAINKTVEIIKHEYPNTPLLVRAIDRQHAADLINAGVEHHVREVFESALLLAAETLSQIDVDDASIEDIIRESRQRDLDRLTLEVANGMYAARDLIRGNAPLPDKPTGTSPHS